MADKPEPTRETGKSFRYRAGIRGHGGARPAAIGRHRGVRSATWTRPRTYYPGVGGVVVLVREDQAEEAAAMIEEFSKHPATDADEAVSEEQAGPKP